MYPTVHLLKQQRMIKPIRRGLLGGIKDKFLYPIREPPPPPPQKEKKPKKVKEEPAFMVQHTYKQAMKGLYNKAHIQFGNKVSESGNKSRRTWKPNVHYVKLYSEALDKRIEIKCTAEVLKIIDRKGGLDRYLIAMRDKDLGEKMYRLKYIIKAKKDVLEGKIPTDNPIIGGNKRLQEGNNRNLMLESGSGGNGNRKLMSEGRNENKINGNGNGKLMLESGNRNGNGYGYGRNENKINGNEKLMFENGNRNSNGYNGNGNLMSEGRNGNKNNGNGNKH